MTIYIDLIFIINYIFDFIILIATSIILKRHAKFYKILLGSLVGSITILILFVKLSTFNLILFKVFTSILMVLITFSYTNIKYTLKNLYYLYMISIILGGFITFIKNNINDNISILSSILLSILLVMIYIKQLTNLKINHNKYYKLDIKINSKTISVNSFLDTGNKLKDPYLKLPIILLRENLIKEYKNILYVPYNTISSTGLLKCIKADDLYIDNKKINRKFLIGLTSNINIDGVDAILNERLLEG